MVRKDERAPSESEWRIMEILWQSETSLTSAEVIRRMKGTDDPMTPKMIRVLMNRLTQKRLLGYEVDPPTREFTITRRSGRGTSA